LLSPRTSEAASDHLLYTERMLERKLNDLREGRKQVSVIFCRYVVVVVLLLSYNGEESARRGRGYRYGTALT